MATLIKFVGTKELFSSEKKIMTALGKQKMDDKVIDDFVKEVKKKKRKISDAFIKVLLEDPKLQAVDEKYGINSKEYKEASGKIGKTIPVELIVSSGKPFLMVGKTVCVP
ncbi:hypothetical protein [Pseudovibrio sp. Tun.PSC04-5.I4]|uniref:hypothetical protein n=1 Tax=Pseudovibrio sp. Tun.PSC04-5.I4 TaxID=1798213 RepID=UPI000883821A|nr:hypothetical protein [Pseudovibrio sp. Tun.PSC04-5.I4]SDR19361.1 hypothetical protein SAMN04515695_3312 [Pseudovibrio sp. Tun.PSC04-5.I4]